MPTEELKKIKTFSKTLWLNRRNVIERKSFIFFSLKRVLGIRSLPTYSKTTKTSNLLVLSKTSRIRRASKIARCPLYLYAHRFQ